MADPRDLCTLDEARAYLGSAWAKESPLAVLGLITGVSAWIEQYLARPLLAQSYSETRNGTGTTALNTLAYPIIGVSSVVSQGEEVPAVTDAAYSAGYTFSERQIYLRGGWDFPRGVLNVVLSYTAGYATPGQLALLDAPAWAAGRAQAVGDLAVPAPANGLTYTAVQAGTTGATAPTWPTAPGRTVVDGTVTWRCQGAVVALPAGAPLLPPEITTACLQQLKLLTKARDRMGESSIGEGPTRVTFYNREAHPSTKLLLDPFRNVCPVAV